MDTETSPPSLAQRLRARPVLTGGVVVAALTGLGVVVLWFQPQTLLFDDVVDEAFPTAESSAVDAAEQGGTADPAVDAVAGGGDVEEGDATDVAGETEDGAVDPVDEEGVDGAEPEAPAEPVALAIGSFESRNRYTVTGQATYYELPDGSRTLRLEDFESTNGPDLYVYLTSADSADTDAAIDEDVVDLGVLTGNVGNQNYAIPDDVDLDRYDTVVIWCLRFTVGFGAADLLPA